MKIGSYVRTKYGYIRKIINEKYDDIYETDYYEQVLYPEDIKGTPSLNIIDLIEVGDIICYRIGGDLYYSQVEEHPEFEKYKLHIQYIDKIINIEDLQIVSIVTKEQFAIMEYRLGDK